MYSAPFAVSVYKTKFSLDVKFVTNVFWRYRRRCGLSLKHFEHSRFIRAIMFYCWFFYRRNSIN